MYVEPPQTRAFPQTKIVRFRTAFRLVLEPQNRLTIVLKQGPKGISKPASFHMIAIVFLWVSGAPNFEKNCKNLKENNVLAKSDNAIPSRKIVDCVVHVGRQCIQNRRKWRSENVSKIDRLPQAIFIDLGRILGSKSRPEIIQKSLKIGLVSYLGRKPELQRLQGASFDVLGVIWERF